MEMNQAMKSKMTTMIKLPLTPSKNLGVDNMIPKIVITPCSRGNSFVEPCFSEDHLRVQPLIVPVKDWMSHSSRNRY